MEHTSSSLLSTPAAVAIALLALIYLKLVAEWRARTRGRPFPPGPPPLPIVGNFFNMAKQRPWISYRDLCAKYGDIIHFRVLGQSIVVLGNADVIFEYLDKRSATTSDRHRSPMTELSGSAMNFAFMPYGQWWRRHRRVLWQQFNREAILKHRLVQVAFVHRFLKRLLDDPSQFQRHIRYSFVGTLLKIVYDIDIDKVAEDYLTMFDQALEGPAQGLIPGRFLVEFLPFLRHIPTWMPGARSQRLWAKWMTDAKRITDTPYNHVKALLDRRGSKESESPRSIIGKLLLKVRNDLGSSLEEEEEILKGIGMVSIEAGGDTTFSTLQSMFLAMSLHPNVLKKAHAELDAVVGPDRLPDFDDFESLVYIQAIVKESMRWHNVVPLGVAHSTIQDDEFNGYFVPAGTILIPNTWACMHDPDVYENPEEFRPERFIKDGKIDRTVRDPSTFIFGFGRRICPGRYIAEAGMFVNMASMLHVFDISPPVGEDGRPIKVKHVQSDGFLSYPEDCRLTIKPRSAQAEALVRSYASEAHRAEE